MKRLKRLGILFDNVGRNFALQGGNYGGHFTGQLGKSVVGATWKDKKTLRTYAKPTNPNSSAQQSVRGKFKLSQVAGSSLLETVVKPYWNPFANSQSGFNRFIGINSQRVSSSIDFISLLALSGSYEGVASIISATYATGTGIVSVQWSPTIQNIGSDDDEIIIIILDTTDYDPAEKTPILLSYYSKNTRRSEEYETVNLKTGLTASDIYVYVGTKQPIAQKVLRIGTTLSQACAV